MADIGEAIDRIVAYVGAMSYEEFVLDIKTQDAVIRNIEIIGEAAKSVSEQLRAASPQVPWRSLAGMRDRLLHQYFGVNLDIVWPAIPAPPHRGRPRRVRGGSAKR